MARHEKFDFVLNVGDEMDLGSQSRWAKGSKLEFAETLDEDRKLTQDGILYDLMGLETDYKDRSIDDHIDDLEDLGVI
jgi:hypothetical protein